MSYPKDLEEYTDEELKEELQRRNRVRLEGKCSYCLQPLGGHKVCKLHEVRTGIFGTMVQVRRM